MWNLEGVVGARPSISAGQPQSSPAHFKFTFAPKDVQSLVSAISSPVIINDANNHILDFGYDGLNASRTHLRDMHLAFFGDVRGARVVQDVSVLHRKVGTRVVSFVSYNQFLGADPQTVAARIVAEKAAGRDVIVYTHWGTEYERGIEVGSQRIARQFIDAGARLVIGSHPHVAQPIETYKGGVIFYSLGNLLFDQFFSAAVRQRPLAGCVLSDTETLCAITPLEYTVHDGLTFQTLAQRSAFFDWLAAASRVDLSARSDLRRGIVRVAR